MITISPCDDTVSILLDPQFVLGLEWKPHSPCHWPHSYRLAQHQPVWPLTPKTGLWFHGASEAGNPILVPLLPLCVVLGASLLATPRMPTTTETLGQVYHHWALLGFPLITSHTKKLNSVEKAELYASWSWHYFLAGNGSQWQKIWIELGWLWWLAVQHFQVNCHSTFCFMKNSNCLQLPHSLWHWMFFCQVTTVFLKK